MSCQQVSRFITNSNNLNLNHNNNNNCKILNNNIQQQQQQLNNTIKGNRNTRTIATAGGGGGLIVVQQQQQQQEDPYVFTESVPTPPILFNTQKTRTRLNDLPSGTTLSIGKLQQQQKLPLTETNGKITLNSLKTQASYISSSSSAATSSPSITTSATTTTNTCSAAATSTFKNNVTQSLTTTTITTTTTNNCNSNKKLTNICIVRPQLQQQQPQHYQHQNYINSSTISSSVYEGDLKSISPPPLYTPPTPSLWQTPLLLESSVTAGNTTSFPNNGMVMAKSLTTTTTTPTSLRCTTPTIHTSTAVGLSSSNNNTSAAQATTAVTTNHTSSMTTTAMAKVAPIIVHTPTLATANATSSSPQQSSPTTPNQCLPPSKFHNHTLAQHLQKVECLKNSKKSLELEENLPEKLPPPTPSSTSPQKTAALKLATSPVKHSENEDLNEIPVNVIFRMAMVPQTNEKSSNNIQFVKPQTEIDTQTTKQVIISPSPSLSSSATTTATLTSSSSSSAQQQLKTNVNKKLSTIPASKIITTTKLQQQQINTSSIQQPQQQQKQNNATTTALNSQPNNNTNNNSNNEKDETNSKTTTTTTATTPTIKETLTKLTTNNSNVSITKIKNSTHISTPKTNRKLNPLNSSTTIKVSKDLSAADNGWQIDGCSTTTKGAVAIVKMSQHNIDLDTTHLATATGLPYCLQQYWLDANDYRKLSSLASSSSSSSCELLAMDKLLNRSLAREERIALYKQQLRRQAMQLLSTRSLQKLPIQIARRRLMCVDRLLRKYQQNEQNKKELPANVKRCCVNGCDAYTIELASHCQKHIVYNSAQHVFLPCTAKFADNTQCRVPVFDINHDLPLCMEHARKRDAYNRHLYEQRPRKISTNPMAINDTNLTTTTTTTATSTKVSNNKNIVESKVKGSNTITGTGTGGIGGILIKTQNYQQQQKQKQHQQQQNILQQLPTNQYINSNNGNKRPTLVNQQQSRKRKMTNAITVAGAGSDAGFNGNPVGRPQKRVKKNTEKMLNTKTNNTTATTATLMTTTQMPRLTTTNLKRKSSTTSLESIASNSQHSTASSTSQQQQQQQPQQQYQRQQPQQQQQHLYGNSSLIANTTTTSSSASSSLPPPALAPLSGSGLLGHGLPQHLFSFGHDNHHHNHHSQQYQQQPPPQQQHQLQPLNINDKHSFIPATATASSSTTTTASTPTELKDFIQQFSLLTQKQNNQQSSTADKMNDINLLNTNSNSNFTSSGMGSTTSLPTADDFLTQDMLSICENSSASSADTGLGGLSDPELMLGGTEDDIPLGDTHLLEEHDLENVLNSLPEDAFKELFTAVHQDESDEIERAIELADKHLKTLQQTIGSELGDFLDFNDDMLMDNGDLCNGSTANTILDTSALFIGGGGLMGAAAAAANGSISVTAANTAQNGGSVIGTDIRGLVQT